MTLRPVTAWLRVDDRGPAHTRLSVFVGRTPGQRGRAGELTLRTDEWDELADRLPTDLEVCSPYEERFSHELAIGDVLAEGGTVTAVNLDRDRGLVTAEVDWTWMREWPAYTIIRSYREGQR